MNKKELLELIREESNKIEHIKDSLDDRLDGLIEIKKAIILLVPDDDDKHTEFVKEGDSILRE